MFLKNLSLRAKLGLSFGVLCLLVLALGGLSLFQLNAVNTVAREMRDDHLPNVQLLAKMQVLILRTRTNGARLISADTEALRTEVMATLARRDAEMSAVQAAYVARPAAPEARAIYADFEKAWNAYNGLREAAAADVRAGDSAKAQRTFNTTLSTGVNAVLTELQKLIDREDRMARASGVHAQETYDTARLVTAILIAVALLCAAGAAALLVLGVSVPLRRMTQTMGRLAEGDVSAEVPYVGQGDEIGAMAGAVRVFKDNIVQSRALEEETRLARLDADAQRRMATLGLADRFEAAVGGIVAQVSSAATELQATAGSLSGTASKGAERSTQAAASAGEAATNVTTVAAAAEELGSSVTEIGRQVQGSANLSRLAVSEAGETVALVRDLNETAARIGDVVAMIATIAGQTNLLALNATIEAARAGEAGRGFAVVAAEVKELANQTARATDEITSQIGRIQVSTGQAVTAIGGITTRIREISAVASSIAAAVEEQGAATQEIVRNVTEAASGTDAVTRIMGGVAATAEETGAAAAQVLSAASELSRQSEDLRGEVSHFLATVRAA
jgi:methyl-accepting chemotaxis protein